jgi:ABC-type glycerol-3-phosphate transport system substrate-binding protein
MSEQSQNRKVNRRDFLRMTALTGAGLLAVSCAPATQPGAPAQSTTGQAPAAPTTAPSAGGAQPKLRLVVMDYDQNMKKDTQALIDAWNAQGKSQVELNVLSWNDGHNTLLTQISGGQPPDMANGNAQWLGEWGGIGEVLPLDGVLPKDFLAAFQPSALKAFTVNNQLMALPYFLDPRAMYYRKDLFDAAGLKAPETWDDVVAAGTKLHKPPDMTGYGMTFARKNDDMDYFWYAFIGVNGADGDNKLWDANKKSRLASDQSIQAVQWLADLNLKHKICNADIPAAGRDDGLQPLFSAGKLAMLETGSWYPTLLKQTAPDLKYAVGTIPTAKAGMTPITAFWPDCVMVFKKTKDQAVVSEFLQWMFNHDNRLTFAKQRGVIPERIDVGTDPAYATGPTEKYFVEQLKTAVSAYDSPFPANL